MPHLPNPNTDQQAPQELAGFLKPTHRVSHKEAVQTYQQAQEFVYGQCDECHGEGEIHHRFYSDSRTDVTECQACNGTGLKNHPEKNTLPADLLVPSTKVRWL